MLQVRSSACAPTYGRSKCCGRSGHASCISLTSLRTRPAKRSCEIQIPVSGQLSRRSPPKFIVRKLHRRDIDTQTHLPPNERLACRSASKPKEVSWQAARTPTNNCSHSGQPSNFVMSLSALSRYRCSFRAYLFAETLVADASLVRSSRAACW
jgi:hypothetical protein